MSETSLRMRYENFFLQIPWKARKKYSQNSWYGVHAGHCDRDFSIGYTTLLRRWFTVAKTSCEWFIHESMETVFSILLSDTMSGLHPFVSNAKSTALLRRWINVIATLSKRLWRWFNVTTTPWMEAALSYFAGGHVSFVSICFKHKEHKSNCSKTTHDGSPCVIYCGASGIVVLL